MEAGLRWGMEYAPYIFLAVAIAVWIAYKLFRYFAKKALFLAYITIAFIVFLMIVAAFLYF